MRKIHLMFMRTRNHVIGSFDASKEKNKNTLPFYCQEFRRLASQASRGNVVLMGRKTWEGIVEDGRPPEMGQSQTIVLTNQKNYKAPGASVYNDIFDVMNDITDKDICVMGGAEVLKQMLQFADDVLVGTLQMDMHVPPGMGELVKFEFTNLMGVPDLIEIGEAFMHGEEYAVRIEHHNLKG